VSAIKRLLTISEKPDVTDTATVRLILRGAKRTLGARQRQKEGLLPERLLRIRETLQLSRPLHLAFWTALLTGWWCFLREANLVGEEALSVGAVHLLSDTAQVRVERSKTLQFGDREHTTFLPRLCDSGERGRQLCPWLAMAAHLQVNGGDPAERLFAFRVGRERRPLSDAVFVSLLKSHLCKAGLQPELLLRPQPEAWSGHLRRSERHPSRCDQRHRRLAQATPVLRYVGDVAATANKASANALRDAVLKLL
jgi:hypothetical protein